MISSVVALLMIVNNEIKEQYYKNNPGATAAETGTNTTQANQTYNT